MFGRRDTPDNAPAEGTAPSPVAPRPVASPAEPRSLPIAGASPGPTPARRVEATHAPAPAPRRTADRGNDGAERRLTVGRGLSVTGEITACDILVVEGRVEAKLSDGKILEITESGQFRGNVEIESADIAGRYDGQLTVHGRLAVRGTGRLSGVIKYGELEVSAGGQIIGEMQVVGAGAQIGASASSGGPSFKSAAKFTTLTDEEDDSSAESRKAASA